MQNWIAVHQCRHGLNQAAVDGKPSEVATSKIGKVAFSNRGTKSSGHELQDRTTHPHPIIDRPSKRAELDCRSPVGTVDPCIKEQSLSQTVAQNPVVTNCRTETHSHPITPEQAVQNWIAVHQCRHGLNQAAVDGKPSEVATSTIGKAAFSNRGTKSSGHELQDRTTHSHPIIDRSSKPCRTGSPFTSAGTA